MLTMPGGSLLLAGRSGVGRRTAVLLVAHMHHMELVSPKITRGYGTKQFKTDLKTVAVVLSCALLIDDDDDDVVDDDDDDVDVDVDVVDDVDVDVDVVDVDVRW